MSEINTIASKPGGKSKKHYNGEVKGGVYPLSVVDTSSIQSNLVQYLVSLVPVLQ